jgi:tRNA uracil 4-sulfurtransferase
MTIIVRYGEIALKGKNRISFEMKLVSNIADCLKKNNIAYSGIERRQGRIIIHTNAPALPLKKVFGITSFSDAVKTNADIHDISEGILSLTHHKKFNTFRISSRRITKTIVQNSAELNNQLGSFIVEKTGKKVKLEKPDLDLGVEIIGDFAYLFTDRVESFGGLPLGIEGRIAVLVASDADVLAALLMMKRGCGITLINNSGVDAGIIDKYSYGEKVEILADMKYIHNKKILGIVTGDTLEKFNKLETNLMQLTPLIAYDEERIESELKCFQTL